MKQLDHIQKLAVLHCVFQTIASADGNVDEERDFEAISLALESVGLQSIHMWDAALKLDPHDCFYHISTMSTENKETFKKLINSVVCMGGNEQLRRTCAGHLLVLCRVDK